QPPDPPAGRVRGTGSAPVHAYRRARSKPAAGLRGKAAACAHVRLHRLGELTKFVAGALREGHRPRISTAPDASRATPWTLIRRRDRRPGPRTRCPSILRNRLLA